MLVVRDVGVTGVGVVGIAERHAVTADEVFRVALASEPTQAGVLGRTGVV